MDGDLKGRYLSAGVKEALVRVIAEVKADFLVTTDYCCQALQLEMRRYRRWINLYRKTGRYGGGRSGPKKAPHGLLPEEKQRIKDLARADEYADLSPRQLSVIASEKGIVEASASSFYRVMKEDALMEKRIRVPRTPEVKPEVKVDRPNQVWSWDLTYIALGPFFVYLFAIIDVYSRKIVGWHLSLNATVKAMKIAWDKALTSEGLLVVSGAPEMPVALSDHGVQMAQKSAKQFFRDLGIKQLFARYQTPKDNAWIESWFRILKYDWLRFKDYLSFSELEEIIHQFIEVYNRLRYHGAIGYVTPEDMHSGIANQILSARAERKRLAKLKRLEENRKLNGQIQQRQAA